MIKKALAAAALVIVAVFAVPTAAQAAYVPDSLISSPGAIGPGQTGTVAFADGAFAPGEPVQFVLTGEDAASATLAAVVTAVSSTSTTKSADANGAASVAVTLPATATGAYTLSATGLVSGNIATVSVSSVVSDGGSGSGSSSGSGSGSSASGSGSGSSGIGGLPNTGAMDPTLGIWAGGGLLALGAAFVIVLTVVRRQKASN